MKESPSRLKYHFRKFFYKFKISESDRRAEAVRGITFVDCTHVSVYHRHGLLARCIEPRLYSRRGGTSNMRRTALAAILLCLGWVLAAEVAQARPASAEDEVIAAEQARAEALVHQDYAALDKILADDLVYCHASGHLDTKASYLALMHANKLYYFAVDSKGLRARTIGKIAVLNGPVAVRARNGTPEVNDVKIQVTEVYEKRDGRWQLISFQATPMADAPTLRPAK
jgi:hypothetical protein